MEEQTASAIRRYLTLTLGQGSCFAIDIFSVREILDFTDITRVPHMPPAMRGVVDVRGEAVPVMDLGQRLGLGPVAQSINTRIVIMEQATEGKIRLIGGLTESVKEVLELDDAHIVPPPSMGTAASAACIRGIGRHGDRFVIVLDTQHLFNLDEVLDLTAVVAQENAADAA
ncbi:CheW protein [Solidesulfovibrio fructosivorans JJ]]|uniref:CheW protein n=1 Tax=Solidesulfovibrio fructosivorans JJ] TaxID=596151 RepID=E1JT24_SOLFR|nr:chemotaxis protein CheW [Solidesulfovibrio fructosivorans]EFL52657.1 CheW protein [Solidesulfovibrio fructosivorans JJ]]